MRRNKLAILVLLLSGFGCRQPGPQRVYVDFEAVLASYRAVPLPSHPVPKPPPGISPETLAIPSVPPRTVVVEGTSQLQGGAVVELNRTNAIKELTDLLSRRYVREAERAGNERIKTLEPKKRAAMEAAQQKVYAEFQAYADKRGVLVAKLTSLVGFPDPNPNSVPPAASVPVFVERRLADAADLRKQISSVDADYNSRVVAILTAAEKQYNVDLEAEILQTNEDRQAAIARATNEAMAEAAKTYKSIAPLIMGPTEVNLPGEPAQSVTLPAVPAPISAPAVRQQSLNLAQRKAILRSQLQIWLSLNGYQQASSPGEGKDMTAEFMKWRQERNL